MGGTKWVLSATINESNWKCNEKSTTENQKSRIGEIQFGNKGSHDKNVLYNLDVFMHSFN